MLLQWQVPFVFYLIYRFLLMVYVIFWLGYTSHFHGSNLEIWGAYLTNWTYTLLTVYMIVHCLVVSYYYVCTFCGQDRYMYSFCRRMNVEYHTSIFAEQSERMEHEHECVVGEEPETEVLLVSTVSFVNRPPWYMCITWVLFSAVSTGAVMVTIVFFAFLFPVMKGASVMSLENVQLHLLNSVIILLENFITGIPCRLLHVVYPILYGLLYLLFSLIYWAVDHSHVMYPILDWNKPGPTVGFVFLIGFVFIPIIYTFFFLLYRLKMSVFHLLYRRANL